MAGYTGDSSPRMTDPNQGVPTPGISQGPGKMKNKTTGGALPEAADGHVQTPAAGNNPMPNAKPLGDPTTAGGPVNLGSGRKPGTR